MKILTRIWYHDSTNFSTQVPLIAFFIAAFLSASWGVRIISRSATLNKTKCFSYHMQKKKPFKNDIVTMHTPAQKFQCHNCLSFLLKTFSSTTNLYINPFPVGNIYCALASPYRAARIWHALNISSMMHKYEQFPPAALSGEIIHNSHNLNCLKQESQTQSKCR